MMEAQDYSSALLASSVLMMALTTMAIVMRLAVRLGVLGGLGWDDVLVGTGWVFAMVLYATTIAGEARPVTLSKFSRNNQRHR